MTALEQKLGKWRVLYGDLEQARERLKQADAGRARCGPKANVILLQRACGLALRELQDEYARVKIANSPR
jgi:hypothetical protein